MAKKVRIVVDFDAQIGNKIKLKAKSKGETITRYLRELVLEHLFSGEDLKKHRLAEEIFKNKYVKKSIRICIEQVYGSVLSDKFKIDGDENDSDKPVVKEELRELTEEEDMALCQKLLNEIATENYRKKKAEEAAAKQAQGGEHGNN